MPEKEPRFAIAALHGRQCPELLRREEDPTSAGEAGDPGTPLTSPHLPSRPLHPGEHIHMYGDARMLAS